VALITFILLGVKTPTVAGAVAGLDLRDARDDAGWRVGFVLPERDYRKGRFGKADEMKFFETR